MAGGRKPDFRIQYKAKDGMRYECAVAWESERFPGLFDLKPQKTNESGQYPKMRLSEAAAAVERGEGFLSLSTPRPQGQQSPEQRGGGSYDRAQNNGGFGGGGDDSDIPFDRRDRGVQC